MATKFTQQILMCIRVVKLRTATGRLRYSPDTLAGVYRGQGAVNAVIVALKAGCRPLTICLVLLLSACSVRQVINAAPLDTSSSSDAQMVLVEEVTIKARNSRPTVLRAGTRWSRIGTIEQGDVYETKDQVVIVNSFDVHEASIVVLEETVVGYFLEVEETFVEVNPMIVNLTWE